MFLVPCSTSHSQHQSPFVKAGWPAGVCAWRCWTPRPTLICIRRCIRRRGVVWVVTVDGPRWRDGLMQGGENQLSLNRLDETPAASGCMPDFSRGGSTGSNIHREPSALYRGPTWTSGGVLSEGTKGFLEDFPLFWRGWGVLKDLGGLRGPQQPTKQKFSILKIKSENLLGRH